ncbi:protein kinase family protein [Streptomyces pinistramenti]|uniref:protein kinase family protein n=1 Tax=Streptomyces pinistramenti TaxID=2884812 RepID=UPI001D05D8DA|nr:protein kinase family protein [Streptomyces pinistramenti]MCB5906917.1 protein kinase family protein [Streptomyces pinistramenti]
MPQPDSSHAARLAAYASVGTRLSLLSDRRIGAAVAAATPLGTGIGGRSAELDVGGTRVFVKRIPLTDIESRPEHVRSTANLFGLPLHYQYGVGSAGFGAWRELAVHIMSTHWVLGGAYGGFPLMYHWRVLPDSPPVGFADEFGGIDGAVAHWEGSRAVRGRLEAIARSTSSLVVFLEYVPQTLAGLLDGHRGVGGPDGGDGSRYLWADAELARGTAFLRSQGLVHFDAHFGNILTDGRRIYFADFGLALASGFELAPEEAAFHTAHLAYDRWHSASHLLHHLLRGLLDGERGGAAHEAFLRAWTEGRRPDGVPSRLAAVIDRHARSTVVIDGFRRRLLRESKRTPFPAARLGTA